MTFLLIAFLLFGYGCGGWVASDLSTREGRNVARIAMMWVGYGAVLTLLVALGVL